MSLNAERAFSDPSPVAQSTSPFVVSSQESTPAMTEEEMLFAETINARGSDALGLDKTKSRDVESKKRKASSQPISNEVRPWMTKRARCQGPGKMDFNHDEKKPNALLGPVDGYCGFSTPKGHLISPVVHSMQKIGDVVTMSITGETIRFTTHDKTKTVVPLLQLEPDSMDKFFCHAPITNAYSMGKVNNRFKDCAPNDYMAMYVKGSKELKMSFCGKNMNKDRHVKVDSNYTAFEVDAKLLARPSEYVEVPTENITSNSTFNQLKELSKQENTTTADFEWGDNNMKITLDGESNLIVGVNVVAPPGSVFKASVPLSGFTAMVTCFCKKANAIRFSILDGHLIAYQKLGDELGCLYVMCGVIPS